MTNNRVLGTRAFGAGPDARNYAKVATVFIIASLLVALSLGGLVVATVSGPAPTISIGAVAGGGVPEGDSTRLSIPVEIHNGGLLAIRDAAVGVRISDSSDHQLIVGAGGGFVIAPGSTQEVNVMLTADLRSVPQDEVKSLLTKDQKLALDSTLRASLPPLADVKGTAKGTLPWGALIENLTFGPGTVTPFNSTYSKVSWPLSFSNRNQYFHLVADLKGTVSDQAGNFVGRIASSSIVVMRGTAFTGSLTAFVKSWALRPTGQQQNRFEVALDIQQIELFQAEISVVLNA